MAAAAVRKRVVTKTGKKKMVCAKGCSESPKSLTNFYKSTRDEYDAYDGYCTTCKTCLRKLSIDQNLKVVTMPSIKEVLMKLDKPLIEHIFLEIANNPDTTNANFLGNYISLLNCYPKYKHCDFSDTVDIQIEHEKILNAKVEAITQIEVTDEMKRYWGRGLDNQDYLDLQTMFDNLTVYEESMDYKKESDYKSLCIYELQKSKIQFNVESIKSVETLQKMIDTLSSNLGIKAVQKRDGFDNNKFVLGLICRYHEDIVRRPIRRWVEDLGNVDLLKNIIEVHYTGNMAMAMGINHPKFESYKEELEKYSVVFDDEEVIEDGED